MDTASWLKGAPMVHNALVTLLPAGLVRLEGLLNVLVGFL
jgi:hypothetical protein